MIGIQSIINPKASVIPIGPKALLKDPKAQDQVSGSPLEQSLTDKTMDANKESDIGVITEPDSTTDNQPNPAAESEPSEIKTGKDALLDEDSSSKVQTKLLTPSNGIFDEETDSESDMEDVFIKRSTGRAALLSDDDDDDDDYDDKVTPDTEVQESGKKEPEIDVKLKEHSEQLFKSDIFDADSESENEQEKKKKKQKRVRATILSDDDEDDDDEVDKKADDKRKKKRLLEEIGSDSERGSGSDGETSSKRLVPEKDDLSDQNQDADRPDASERAKSPHKHGSRTPKPRRLKKEAIQKIHSESQRLIRESALRLPYHKPKQLTVDDFFNKRPPSARPLKPLRGLSRAATEEKKLEPMEVKNDATDLPDPFSSETTEKTIGLPDDLSTKNINIGDSLGSQTVTMATEHIASTDSIKSSSEGEDGEAKGETGTIGSKTENESFIDEIVSLVGQKSGDLSPEGEKFQTEAKVENDPKVGDLDNIKNTEGLLETSPGDGDRCLVKVTPASSGKRQSTAMRLLQASLDKFKNVTPKLSGESERVICLEEETPKTEIPAGVENLMERFARHSTKKSRGRKTQQEVQLSIVKKATNEDGKEDLKAERISIILEPEDQEINPKLKVPGAKLLHLKETLQQRMKERREQEREKRQMAYNIDNEEMGGGEGEEEEEEEEAELSDGDMSDKEYRMGAEVDSEDDDEDFNPDDEIVREKHMFADDEAEDDDDEVSEEEVADDHVRKVESNSQKKMTPKPSDGNKDSGDEISPQSRKTKTNSKRRILLSDDEDDEDEDGGDFQETSEIKSQIKIIHQAPKETVKIPDIHQETSRLSSSSSKTSSVKKSDSSSVTHYVPDVGKTMDLFDSTSSLTDDVKNNDLTSEDKQTTFNLKEHLGRQETSTLSSSSSKTSSVKKSDSSSVTHYFPGVGKTMDLFDSTSSLTDDLKSNDLTSDNKQTTFNLKAHLGRQDSVTSKTSEADNNSVTSLDNSFEMFPATIPPYQPRRESLDDSDDLKCKENFTPFSKAKISLEHSSAKSTSKFPELSLPVEDSQDLFQMDTPSLMMPDSQRETETQNFRFSFDEDETQTQFLDGNGFLKLKSSAKRPGPRKIFQTENASEGNMDELLGLCSGQFNQDDARSGKVFHNENASQGNMDELLGLCSGRFSKQDDTDSPKVYKNEVNTQGNMNELLGLCSGQFKEDREDKEGTPRVLPSQTSFRKGLFSQMKSQDNVSELIGLCSGNFSSNLEEDKIDKSMQKSKELSDKDSESSFSLVFDQETLKEELREDKREEDGESSDDEPIILTRKKKPVTKRNEEEDGVLLPYDSDDELEVNRNAFKGKTYSKFAKKKFFEQEAELSGSDADSDEDYDAEEEPDELELDKEVEEQFKDTEELREQVNEIHMKATDDEDARRLRLFKELYLRDGDLHSEKSRVRRFRWKHLDEMEMDGGGGGGNGDSEDEGAEEDDQDTQWRLQRYQREQWLKEQDKETGQKAPEEPPPVLVEDEDSQFPLSMKIVSRHNSKGSLSSSGTASNPPPEPVEKFKEKKEFNSPKPLKMHKHGSFLKRQKQELEKLASVVKPLANITRPKNNRGFIFQSLSQTNMETEKLSQPSKVKRSISVQGPSGQHAEGPQSKRPKLERSVSQTSSGSIFNHF